MIAIEKTNNTGKLLVAILAMVMLAAGITIALSDDNVSADIDSATEVSADQLTTFEFVSGTEYKLSATATITTGQTVDLNGAILYLTTDTTLAVNGGTIQNGTIISSGVNGIFTSSGTFKNVTFDGFRNAVYVRDATQNGITITNCVFNGSETVDPDDVNSGIYYCIYPDNNNTVTVTDCTFNGYYKDAAISIENARTNSNESNTKFVISGENPTSLKLWAQDSPMTVGEGKTIDVTDATISDVILGVGSRGTTSDVTITSPISVENITGGGTITAEADVTAKISTVTVNAASDDVVIDIEETVITSGEISSESPIWANGGDVEITGGTIQSIPKAYEGTITIVVPGSGGASIADGASFNIGPDTVIEIINEREYSTGTFTVNQYESATSTTAESSASITSFGGDNVSISYGSIAIGGEGLHGTITLNSGTLDLKQDTAVDGGSTSVDELTINAAGGTTIEIADNLVINGTFSINRTGEGTSPVTVNGSDIQLKATMNITGIVNMNVGAIVGSGTPAPVITLSSGVVFTYSSITGATINANGGIVRVDGSQGTENIISHSQSITGNQYLSANTTILPGVTLTIPRNATLDLQQYNLIVQGTLVIEGRGVITSSASTPGSILIASTGSIQNEGTIGNTCEITIANAEVTDEAGGYTQYISVREVTGVSIELVRSVVDDERVYNMAVSGDISKVSGASSPSISICNVDVNGDMTIGRDITVTTEGAITVSGAVFTMNGYKMTIEGNSFTLKNGSSLVINAPVIGTVTAETGTVGDNGTVTGTNATVVLSDNTGTEDSIEEYVVGITISVGRVTVPAASADEDATVEQRMYVSGAMDIQTDRDNSNPRANITFTGDVYIDGTLNVPEEIVLPTTGYTLIVDAAGTVVVEGDNVNANALPYSGAKYSLKTTADNVTVETFYYTSFATAMDNIADAVSGLVTVAGEYTITGTYQVGADQEIGIFESFTRIVVGENAEITVDADGMVDDDAFYTILGKVTALEGSGYTPEAIYTGTTDHYVYSVRSVDSETYDTTYSGFNVAMDEATSGQTITVVGDAKYDGNLVIPEGVTVDVDAQMDLYVTGNVTVETGGKLILDLGSTLTVGKDQRDSTVTVAGELDASEGGDIVAYSKAADTSAGTPAEAAKSVKVYSTGTSTFAANKTFTAPVTMNAAYYDDGERVFTTVAAAVAYAQENALIKVNATGVFSESGAVSSNGVDIVIADGADVTLGNVTLNDAYIGPSNNGKYTATVSGLSGAGDAATTSTVSVTKTTATVTSIVTLNAEGVNQYALSINAIVGATTVSAGTVVYADDSMSVNRGNSLTISAGATLLIAEGDSVQITNTPTSQTYYLINEGTIQIDGDVTTVDLALPGTVVIAATGGITAGSLVVTGDVTVEADGTLSVSVSLQVGESPEYLGSAATGSISGEISLNDSAYAIVFAGASIADATFDAVNQPETTQFTVNGIVLADVYTVAGSNAAMTAVDNAVMGCDDLENYNNSDAIPIVWKDGENTINPVTIGDYAVLNTERGYKDVGIVISIGSNITLSVDNVIVGSAYNGFEYPLSIGTHTVSAIVNPGFTGEITITFDGQTIVNGGTIEVTADMIDSGVVLSAIGQLTQDSTVVVDGGSSDDSGMSLTDILLIVLVVLILVMAIIVALRLMRS